MKVLLSFTTPEFRKAAARLADSARPYFDRIKILTPANLPLEFYRARPKHFEHRRGFGFWSWKTWIIARELEALAPDDVLMYCDSQVIFEADPEPLFVLTRQHDGIGIFHQKRERHRNSTWTRRDCFKLMGCDEPRYHEGDNLASTFSVWTKTEKSLAFVQEWARWCSDYDVVSDEPSKSRNLPDFNDHRHDQSILSILAIKHDRFTLDDCSQWGDGYRRPECRYPRILRTDRRVVAPFNRRPHMSSIIEVSALADCPLRCSYCPQDKLGAAYRGPKFMTVEMFRSCLDNLVPGDAIDFSGFTEPAVNPQIIELMSLAIERGHRTRIYTTGRGLDRARAEAIRAMDLGLVMLHLPDAAGHLSHSPGNVEILDILAGHPRAKCMTMDNVAHAEVAHIYDRLPRNYGAMHDRAGNLETVQLPTISRSGPIKCGVAPQLDHSVLLPDGRLALCCCDYSLAHIVGNLSTTPYSEILGGPGIEAVLKAQANGGELPCRQCTYAVPA